MLWVNFTPFTQSSYANPTWSGQVSGGHFCVKRSAGPSVVWAQRRHGRGRWRKVAGTWSPRGKEALFPLPIHEEICKTPRQKTAASTLNIKPSSDVSFGFEPHSVQQPKTKRSHATEATAVDSCPEFRPLTHQSNCLELHHLQATGKTGSRSDFTQFLFQLYNYSIDWRVSSLSLKHCVCIVP